MSCKFMEKKEKLRPYCKGCNTWIVFCRNEDNPAFGAQLSSRTCSRNKCRFYSHGTYNKV